jgi:high affinity Mn2+ porin
MKCICNNGGGTAIVLATCSAALAADLPPSLPVKAPVPYASTAYNWNGLYVGAHAGVIRGASNWAAQPGAGASVLNGSFNLPFNFDFMAGTGSFFVGLQAGYNYVFPSRLMLGIEADVTAPNSDVLIPYAVRGSQTINSPLIGQVTYGEAVMHYGSARARIGYAFDHFLLYGTGGLAWSYDTVTRSQDAGVSANGFAAQGTLDTQLLWRLGWAAGAGVAEGWTAKVEYLSTGFGRKGLTFTAAAEPFSPILRCRASGSERTTTSATTAPMCRTSSPRDPPRWRWTASRSTPRPPTSTSMTRRFRLPISAATV